MILQALLALAIMFTSHFLGGIAAFGSALLALPVLLAVGWELRYAMSVLLLVGSMQSVYMAFLTGRDADWKALLKILLLAGLAIPVGFLSAELLPQRALQIALGVVLVGAGLSRLIERWRGSTWQPPRWVLQALLVLGGIIHGAFGTGGATLTVYARYALRAKEAFRGTLPIMWLILNAVVIGGLILRGDVDPSALAMVIPGVPTILVATFLGHRAAAKLSQERFSDLVALLLCAAGLITVIRNVA
jgi:hypothetical protein